MRYPQMRVSPTFGKESSRLADANVMVIGTLGRSEIGGFRRRLSLALLAMPAASVRAQAAPDGFPASDSAPSPGAASASRVTNIDRLPPGEGGYKLK